MRGRAWVLAALLSGLRIVSVVAAADTPDPRLLEFLGSVDSDDQSWHAYLARTDIDKVARRAATGPANPVGTSAPPAPAAPPPPKPSQPVNPP